MSILQHRIDRLAILLPPPGCEQCRDWNPCVLIELRQDGTEVERSRSTNCPACGRIHTPLAVSALVGIPVDLP